MNISRIIPVLLLLVSCAGTADLNEDLKAVAEQLTQDSKHQYLKTLRPSESDIRAIFESEEVQNNILAFSDSRWNSIDQVDEASMKPTSEDATLVILSATKKDLSNGNTNGISEAYLTLAPHLKDGIVLFGIQYLNSDGTEQKTREVFFKVNGKWILIPRAFVAFE